MRGWRLAGRGDVGGCCSLLLVLQMSGGGKEKIGLVKTGVSGQFLLSLAAAPWLLRQQLRTLLMAKNNHDRKQKTWKTIPERRKVLTTIATLRISNEQVRHVMNGLGLRANETGGDDDDQRHLSVTNTRNRNWNKKLILDMETNLTSRTTKKNQRRSFLS